MTMQQAPSTQADPAAVEAFKERFDAVHANVSKAIMGKPGEIWGVVRELMETYGWTEDEIRGFLGENLLRVYAANWK